MTLNETIEHLKIKVKREGNESDKHLLQWLLELRTLRAQVRAYQSEIDWLKGDYERMLLQTTERGQKR